MLETAVIAPIPAADPVIGALRHAHDPSAREGMPAHVTALYPFVPIPSAATIAELRDAVAPMAAFDVAFRRLARFPGPRAVLYLAPDPVAPFTAITAALATRFGLAPYGGIHDEVIPHLTVAIGAANSLEAPAGQLRPALPIATRVGVLELWERRAGRWRRMRSVPLAGVR